MDKTQQHKHSRGNLRLWLWLLVPASTFQFLWTWDLYGFKEGKHYREREKELSKCRWSMDNQKTEEKGKSLWMKASVDWSCKRGKIWGPRPNIFFFFLRVCMYFAKCWSMFFGRENRERELAWAKYFHKRRKCGEKEWKKEQQYTYSTLGLLLESECWPPPLGSIGKHHPLSCWGAYIHLYFSFSFSSFLPLHILPWQLPFISIRTRPTVFWIFLNRA